MLVFDSLRSMASEAGYENLYSLHVSEVGYHSKSISQVFYGECHNNI